MLLFLRERMNWTIFCVLFAVELMAFGYAAKYRFSQAMELLTPFQVADVDASYAARRASQHPDSIRLAELAKESRAWADSAREGVVKHDILAAIAGERGTAEIQHVMDNLLACGKDVC